MQSPPHSQPNGLIGLVFLIAHPVGRPARPRSSFASRPQAGDRPRHLLIHLLPRGQTLRGFGLAIASGTVSGIDDRAILSVLVSAIKSLFSQLSDLANTVATFAESFTTRELTFQRAIGESLTLTHELCIADGANDNSPLCLTKSQLGAVLSQIGAAALPVSVPSSPPEIREPEPPISVSSEATTTPADLANFGQSDNLSGQDANSTSTPPAAAEPTDAIDATASSTPSASDEPPADQSSPLTADVSTPSPANDNPPVSADTEDAAGQSANDNPPLTELPAAGTE